jgi:hypothetical protein
MGGVSTGLIPTSTSLWINSIGINDLSSLDVSNFGNFIRLGISLKRKHLGLE